MPYLISQPCTVIRLDLAKAFRGELVPTEAELARRDGRDYEPASELLAHIKTDRQRLARMPRKILTQRKKRNRGK